MKDKKTKNKNDTPKDACKESFLISWTDIILSNHKSGLLFPEDIKSTNNNTQNNK